MINVLAYYRMESGEYEIMGTINAIEQFKRQSYLNIETYRKSGQAVATPVWFVERDGVLYIRTGKDSGKVKRIRNNRSVRVAPCASQGDLRGEWVAGTAHLINGNRSEEVNQWLRKKYGLAKLFFDLLGSGRKMEYAVIAVELVKE